MLLKLKQEIEILNEEKTKEEKDNRIKLKETKELKATLKAC